MATRSRDNITDSSALALESVINGLQLKQSNSNDVLKCYTYTMACPYVSSTQPKPVDWHLLSSFHVEGAHIRIHNLKEGNDLKADIKSYQSAHARAVIIINNEESQILSKRFSASLDGFDNFLIVVLSSSEGASLYELFNDGHKIHAKLEVKSVESVAPFEVISLPSSKENGDAAKISGMDSSIHNATKSDQLSKGVFGKIFGSTKPSFNVQREVKKLLLEGETMKRITHEAGTFTLVMSSFSQYDKLSKPDSSQVNSLIRTLFLPFFEPAFPTEFPFYFVLAYRFKKFRLLYDCVELGPFITKCIDAFEALPPSKIADTLHQFFELKDFNIMFGSEEADTSVFSLLATACKDLMIMSTQIKRSNRQSPTAPGSRFISTRMIWIIVHLKCLSEKGLAKNSDIWQTHLLMRNISQNIVLSKEVIDEFKLGIDFSEKLQLPKELFFTICDMIYFVAYENFIRPLASVRNFFMSLESNIKSDRELLVLIMINLRSFYIPFLTSADQRQVVKASQQGTLIGVIEEGISFLDGMRKVWYDRHWNKGEQHKDFRIEILKWLKLLLSVVKITDPNAPPLLKKFLGFNRNSVIIDPEFRKSITDQILADTRNNFYILSIQQFFILYKSFRIWTLNFLMDFLNQYRMPSSVRINDATWSEFFNVVLDRKRSDESQSYIFSFITKIAEKYEDNKRAKCFIPDLTQLNVPQLFAAPRLSSSVESGKHEKTSVGQQFMDFLMSYIQRNNLQSTMLSQLQILIPHITDKKGDVNFQWIILNVLQSVVVPELRSLEGSDNEQIRSILPIAVNLLIQSPSWFGALSPRQMFCWYIVSMTCSKLVVTANKLDWVNNSFVIKQLGVIYNSYCNSRKLYGSKCLLSENKPDEITTCPGEDVKEYFQWVKKVQDILHFWQGKFTSGSINYDELILYASNSVALNALGRAVCAGSCIMEMDSITQVKDTYRYNFEQLNVYLLRYVPGHPEVKYCTLPSLLSKYGVTIPPEVEDSISKHVIFPNDCSIPNKLKLINVIPTPYNGTFKPEQDIVLNSTQEFTLSALQKLIEDLANFLEPLHMSLNMLVFFHLHQSELFEKHLLKQLEGIAEHSSAIVWSPKPLGEGFSLAPSKRNEDKIGIPMILFKSALERVRDLLLKIIQGTFTYSDITSGGAIKLETINTEKEFSTLCAYSEVMNRVNCDGPNGVKSMLELFQFTYHIQMIDSVFEQYGLENCRSDPTLKELLRIVEELRHEGSRAKLTSIEATHKMKFIKESLCLQNATSYECLNLFPAVANSAAFYQFIHDKQFVGHKHNVLFHEQNVLNQLRVTFEFLSPFMESDISFNELMSRVSRLDTTHGMKQLETMSENITLIRLMAKLLLPSESSIDESEVSSSKLDPADHNSSSVQQLPITNPESRLLDLLKEKELKYEEVFKLLQKEKKTSRDLSNQVDQLKLELKHSQERMDSMEAEVKQLLACKENELVLRTKLEASENSWKISHSELTLSKIELGRGAWGVIWIGQFRGQRVAIKQLHKEITRHYRELIDREIQTMARLRHPNLLQFIGAVFDDPSGDPMIITEVMDTSLRKAYENKELTPDPSCRPVILSILHDVAVGLNYLHCLPDPIIHRDVSSANVLLESKGPGKWKTKVSDFGSANAVKHAVTKAPGAFVYSAPESYRSVSIHQQIRKKQTIKMDSFSYGVLFCEVFTCKFPDVDTFQALLVEVKSSSSNHYNLIVCCINSDPDERPTMSQIIEKLN